MSPRCRECGQTARPGMVTCGPTCAGIRHAKRTGRLSDANRRSRLRGYLISMSRARKTALADLTEASADLAEG